VFLSFFTIGMTCRLSSPDIPSSPVIGRFWIQFNIVGKRTAKGAVIIVGSIPKKA
jgi:hypothetical protein